MKPRGIHLTTLLGLFLAPSIAFAAEGAGVRELVWHTFNLSILIAIVVYFARKPLREVMATRRTQIEGELEQAHGDLQRAESQLAEWEQRMNALESELDEIRGAVRSQAESERDRIIADAESGADRIRANASAAVEQEARRARDVLRIESAELALARAGDLIQQRIGEGDRDRLFHEFLTRLGDLPDSHDLDDADDASPPS